MLNLRIHSGILHHACLSRQTGFSLVMILKFSGKALAINFFISVLFKFKAKAEMKLYIFDSPG
jgi:hypothetical protein